MSLTCSTDAPTTSDRSVLVALSCGDATAWEETVRRYEGLLRSSARAVLRNDADVDEAVQRTWVLLFRHAERIHESACLPGWLATTARREALAVLDVTPDLLRLEPLDVPDGLGRLADRRSDGVVDARRAATHDLAQPVHVIGHACLLVGWVR